MKKIERAAAQPIPSPASKAPRDALLPRSRTHSDGLGAMSVLVLGPCHPVMAPLVQCNIGISPAIQAEDGAAHGTNRLNLSRPSDANGMCDMTA